MGNFLSRGLFDAAELCMMFDVILIASTLYYMMYRPGENSSVGAEERRFYVTQIVSGSIGLPATLLVKHVYTFRPAVLLALILSIAATVSFTYSTFANILSLLALRQQISYNTVTVGDHPTWFWFLQGLNLFVMVIISINHGLLGHFIFARVQREAAEGAGLGRGSLHDVL